VPTDHHDLGGVAVALEELCAEWKEVGSRQAVILEDDAALLIGEEPIDCGPNSPLAAQVVRLVQPLDLAGPVDVLKHHAGALATFRVRGDISTGPIGGHIKLPRCRRTDSLEDPLRLLWTVERDHQQWNVSGWAHYRPDLLVTRIARPTNLPIRGRRDASAARSGHAG
jgi:hypothetical protein